MNKKIITRVIMIILITALSGIFIFTEKNPEDAGGFYTIIASDADSIRIGGRTIKPSTCVNAVNKITFNVSGYESGKWAVLLNDTTLGFLGKGECSFVFDSSLLHDGENEIIISPSADGDTISDDAAYRENNSDEIVIISALITFGELPPSKPSAMIKYMPVVGKTEINAVRVPYLESQEVGGRSIEADISRVIPSKPVYIGYTFDKLSDKNTYFSLDTTVFGDGVYKLDIIKANSVIESRSIKIDNTAPEIILSFRNGDVIANSNTIKFDAVDDLPVTVSAEVNNKTVIGNSVSLKSFTEGIHTLYIKASDSLGNTVERVYEFTVKQTIPDYNFRKKDGTAVLSISADATATVYSVNLVGRINMYINRLGTFSMDHLRSSDEALVSFIDKNKLVTESVGNTLPYQSFVIDVGSNTGNAIISYSGETGGGEDILLKVWNYKTGFWDTLGRTDSGVSISFMADIATYSKDGRMRVNACPYVLSNGSDTLLWVSNTKYYSKYNDLNSRYTDIMNYAKEQYLNGNIAYVAHTGDLIDRSLTSDEIAHKEYKIASDAHFILDNALVPNGVVSGDRDIKHSLADYSYFSEYFGSSRYKNFEWYGGSYKNNTHHYDLITIGNYDFLLLYLGCYDEDGEDTVAWANAVLEAYPERNVILCTHEYIDAAGMYSGDRAAVIWERIVVPNENIKIILCGHNEGAVDRLRRVGESDRYVLEILANYQSAELGTAPSHIENGNSCDGEGFIRLMSFNNAGQVITTTYSPTCDIYNYFPSYTDTFVYDLELIPAVRSIRTTDFSVGVNIKKEGVFGKDQINLSSADGAFAIINEGDIKHITEILKLKNKTISYTVFADTTDYKTVVNRFKIDGMSGVAASLRRDEVNRIPAERLAEVGIDLMPSLKRKANHTSGATDYIPIYTEDGKYTIKFITTDTAERLTTLLDINKTVDIDEYDRLYFGVTAEANAKWNICLNLSDGTVLNFSQDMYEHFGYKDYYIPDEIQGTWQGYIPLDDYLKGKVKVTSVYFVSATSDSPITFDYCFIGKSLGEEILFITDEETAYSVDYLKGTRVEAISDPFKNGYSFIGWFDAREDGELIEFPLKVEKGGIIAYSRFIKKEAGFDENANAVFYNNEVEILPGMDYKKLIIVSVIILTVLSGLVAGVVSSVKRRKRHRHLDI
ncbi:MAG: hypothetical protein CVU97_03725 [Firmicutes bacterium HGW-Firmicutes-21]|nr:MAG: hypothetical protein CVU97_03725 [Firmicutes bacterium HGW-Firmicutes-21]